jgi:ATP-dependent exoDNAse (exonuclease V) alpha subunit
MELARSIDGNLEFSEDFAKAFDLLENTTKNVFVTGEAGTGKSTLLQYFRDHTSKKIAVLAPTGVSAINVRGQTVHSFFRFKPDIRTDNVAGVRLRKDQRKVYANLDVIVIDEISMLRADLLDCIDVFLRLHGPYKDLPFGGLQMIFFGDLYQLPPVVTSHEKSIFNSLFKSPFFFDAKSFPSLKMGTIALQKIYRQTEANFIRLLNSIRNNSITSEDINILNSRVDPGFQPDGNDFFIYLTTTNAIADKVNMERLNRLPGKQYVLQGVLEGDFEQKWLPTAPVIALKENAQIMMLNNDPQGRWVNGSIGKIVRVDPDAAIVRVELSSGERLDIEPYQWDMFRFWYNEDTGSIESEPVGSFYQYPLRLAWAVTIHKSQGQTFDKVIVDLGYGAFSHGQVYVALSRCTSFEGLVLRRPVTYKDILLDGRITGFFAGNPSN